MVRCFLIGKEEVHRNAAVFLWHKAQSEATLFNVPVNNKPPQTKTSSMQLISKYFGHFPGFQLTLSASSLGYRVDCNSLKLQAWDAHIIEEIYQPRKKKISTFCLMKQKQKALSKVFGYQSCCKMGGEQLNAFCILHLKNNRLV